MIDDEVITKYNELITTVNKVKDFSPILPDNILTDSFFLNFILYFVQPSFEGLDTLTALNGISLTKKERESIYPHIIEFILFIKNKF